MRTIEILIFLLMLHIAIVAADDEARYADIDRHALSAPVSVTKSIKDLSAYLTRPFITDEEKARAIFRWITDNITYDVEGFFSGRKTEAESGDVLKSRSSVCSGYSSLFEELGKVAGLEITTIDGYAKGFGYQPGDRVTDESNHAWNAVKIRGEWKFIDCTWGAGKVDDSHNYKKEYEPYYFFTKPEEFIYRHLPTNRHWQLLPRFMSRQDFQDLPFVTPVFFQCGLTLDNKQTAVIYSDEEYLMEFSTATDVLCSAELLQKGRKVEDATFLQRRGLVFRLRIVPPEAGEYTLNIYAKKGKKTEMLSLAVSFKVLRSSGTSRKTSFPLTYSAFVEKNVQLQSPLERELSSGETQLFSLIVPDAERVAVVYGEEWDFLKKNENQFEGMVEIGAGKISVFARYPGNREFQELLEYTGTGYFIRAPAPVKYEQFINSGAELFSPLKKELPAETSQLFRIKLPGAKKAAVVFGEKWQFLEKNGDYFEGAIGIGRGKNMVVGVYTSTIYFEGLLEYEGK